MFLVHEPAWKYLLFMSFICVCSLYRIVSPLYLNYREKRQRMKKLTDKVLERRVLEGDFLDRPFKIEVRLMSFEKRRMLALKLLTEGMVFAFSLACVVQLMHTAIHTHRGIVSAGERDEIRATQEYEMALNSDPIAGTLYSGFISMHSEGDWQNGDLREARIQIRLHPNEPEVYNELGSQYMHLERYKEAIKIFRTAVMLRPEGGVYHSNLGSALSADMQVDAAIIEFQRALNISPFFGIYHNSLAGAYYYKQDLVHAEEEYRKAIRDNPALIQPYWRLSDILTGQGRREEAKTMLRNLMKQAHMPEDAVVIGQIRTSIAALK